MPITNTKREPAAPLVHRLSHSGIQVNVTAIMTLTQVHETVRALKGGAPANVSVFAGRVADTGRDSVRDAVNIVRTEPSVELIWASVREVLNIFQADAVGCHVITVTTEILGKLSSVGKDLDEFSLDTVKMFRSDAAKAGFSL